MVSSDILCELGTFCELDTFCKLGILCELGIFCELERQKTTIRCSTEASRKNRSLFSEVKDNVTKVMAITDAASFSFQIFLFWV